MSGPAPTLQQQSPEGIRVFLTKTPKCKLEGK